MKVSGFVHNSSGRRLAGSALGVTLLVCLALLASCSPSVPGPAAESFKKEVQATKESLAPSLMDAVAGRKPRSARNILEQRCSLAKEDGSPFTCGITVLDHHGITLASATPGEPIKRLDYSHYEIVMKAMKERKIVKTKLYLQDHTTLYVVGIPLLRQGEVVGLLVLAFDAADLRNRFGLTEEEFIRVDLNG